MSCEKGNVRRTRTQKHVNQKAFKNNLHDKRSEIEFLNNLEISNVCVRCRDILEWKIKYKKFKIMKAPGKCVKCGERNVKSSYHIMCRSCSLKLKVCPKCDKTEELVQPQVKTVNLESIETKEKIKQLSERKRRTFLRFVEKHKDLDDPGINDIIMEKLNDLTIDCGKSDFDDFDEEDNDDLEDYH